MGETIRKSNPVCVGREEEQEKLKGYINGYITNHITEEKGYVINLYGRGGIGKTVLTKEIYRYYNARYEGSDRKVVYINASGCFDIPELLFRLRMEMGDREFDFEKFDTLYELFYDASRFIQYKYMKEIEHAAIPDDDTARDYTITEQMAERSGKLSQLIVEPSLKLLCSELYKTGKNDLPELLRHSAEIAGPIANRISMVALIKMITEAVKDQKKRSHYIAILQEIGASRGLFRREEKLIEFFENALKNSEYKAAGGSFFLFIDNFRNPDSSADHGGEFVFQNIGTLLEMFRNFPALWFISSRNQLPPDSVTYSCKLKGLLPAAAKEIIENTPGAKDQNNIAEIEKSILHVARDDRDGTKEERYSPIILQILCQVLEKEIESKRGRASDESIRPELFAEIRNRSALAYYFEMGKSSVDLDCFHILSCADIWDEYTLAVLRNEIQLYLLNTKYILARDSMIEMVDKHSIKLHDEIAEALRESVNNRIRYDVCSMMSDAFLKIQESAPITDESVLRNFFGFAKAYCNHIMNGIYDYLDLNAFDVYTLYYEAFLKSIQKAGRRISQSLIGIYRNVVKEYQVIAEKCKVDDFSPVFAAYYKLGIVISDSGDSTTAMKTDEEYRDLATGKMDSFGMANALNALAYDQSSAHLYAEACQSGKESLKAALRGIYDEAEKKNYEPARELYALYDPYFTIPEDNPAGSHDPEETEERIKNAGAVLKEIYDIRKGDEDYSIKKLWEQMLRTRGNIPWYFLKDSSMREQDARYAVDYGKETYLLRKYYYGEDDPGTIQSYHNIGVYLLKYAEYCLSGKIPDAELNLQEAFSSAGEIFSEAVQKRKKISNQEQRIGKEEYLQELKETASEFLNIYSADNIERCYEELSEYSAEALESLQYLSHAYYLSAAVCDENEKNELLQEAIRVSDEVIVARSIVLGPCHRKTLESMRYGAEYYHQCGNRDDAQKRMQYAVDYLNDGQVSKSQIAEYETLLNKIKISQ